MGAKVREYRRRIKGAESTKKITRAMELIAASRIVKAQQRINASRPYAEAITDGAEPTIPVSVTDKAASEVVHADITCWVTPSR